MSDFHSGFTTTGNLSGSFFDGFQELMEELDDIAKQALHVEDVLETGAKEFVTDLLKLPKPMSQIRKAGYTHLIDTFSYRKKKGEIEVGWGKYYGTMVEYGTVKMGSRPHLRPIWDKNKEKYYKKMLQELKLER